MPTDASVSVVVPAFNAQRTLRRTLDSVLAQTTAPLEVIVVDDGSSDATQTVAGASGSRVRILEQSNRGPAAARNLGMQNAKGDVVTLLDADDFWHARFLEACLKFLCAHTEAVAVSVGLRFKQLGREDRVFMPPAAGGHPGASGPFLIDDFFGYWAEHDHIRTGSCAFRRRSLDQVGLQNPNLHVAEDLEFWGLLGTCGKWGVVPEVLWICDSEGAEAADGRLQKYRMRRSLCSTVEEWQQRIVPRLQPCDWPGFRKVRGRVAASLAYDHIVAGRPETARQIVKEYGGDMPVHAVSRLLRIADRIIWPAWPLTCGLLAAWEYKNTASLALRSKLAAGKGSRTTAS